MRVCLQIVGALAGLYVVANFAYFVKSANGINLLPGHHGGLFPMGDWLWRVTKAG